MSDPRLVIADRRPNACMRVALRGLAVTKDTHRSYQRPNFALRHGLSILRTPAMEIDLYLPSFRAMRKRSRSRSPTPCEHDRPLVRTSVFWSLFYSSISAPINRSAHPRWHSLLVTVLENCLRLSHLHNRQVLRPPHKGNRCLLSW